MPDVFLPVTAFAPHRVSGRRVFRLAVLFAASISLVLTLPQPSWARGSITSRVRRVVAAQRQQTISALQKQLAEARQVLAKAESQMTMTAGELQAAQSTLQSIKRQTEADENESRDAIRKLRNLEGKVLAAQGPGSELAQAQSQLEQAQLALDKTVHEILSLPVPPDSRTEAERLQERGQFSAEQKARLNSSPQYQEAVKNVSAAAAQVAAVRHQVLEKDPEWKQAFDARQAAEQSVHAHSIDQRRAGQHAVQERTELRTAAELAAQARQVIAECEARLAALGAKPSTAGGSAPVKSPTTK